MKDFLIENYSWIASLLVGLISLIVVTFRKTKIVMKDTAFEEVLSAIPSFMIMAEKSGKSGKEKKELVVGLAFEYLAKLTGKEITELVDYSKKISDAIEMILSTPVKKEALNESKK